MGRRTNRRAPRTRWRISSIGARSGALLVLMLLLVDASPSLAAGAPSQFVPGGQTERVLGDPANDILIIFTHGSGGNTRIDHCDPPGGSMTGAFGVPEVLRELTADDPKVRVWAFCHRDHGRPGSEDVEATRTAPCGNRDMRETHIKVCLRAMAIEAEIGDFMRLNPGLTSDRIFLAGTSAGGWASLLVSLWDSERQARGKARLANGAIAFAPAFNGKRVDRWDWGPFHSWQRIRETHRAALMGPGPTVDALVFSFECDAYETPDDHAGFQERPGVQLICAPPEGKSCGGGAIAHSCNRRDWFASAYKGDITRFMRQRLGLPVQPPRANSCPAPAPIRTASSAWFVEGSRIRDK